MAKIIQFFMEVKSELSKVVWPSRQDTAKYTGMVVVTSLAVAAILGAADYALVQLIQKFING
jgi:preprotein translocase SecE subunit